MNQKSIIAVLGVVVVILIGSAGYFIIKNPANYIQQSKNTKLSSTLPYTESKTLQQGQPQTPQNSESGNPVLSFVKPKISISINSGDIIPIELHGNGIIELLVASENFSELQKSDGTGIFKFQYHAPYVAPFEDIKSIKFIGMGKTISGAFIQSDELTINISPSVDKLVSMRALENNIALDMRKYNSQWIGDTKQLVIYGKFSDGIERNITSSIHGTKYVSDTKGTLSEVFRVDGEGKITAVQPGGKNIIVTNKYYSGDAISIKVSVIMVP